MGNRRCFHLCIFYVDCGSIDRSYVDMGGIKMKAICRCCGDEFNIKRWELGYKFCLDCGEDMAKAVSEGFTVAIPFNKGAYQYIHNPKELATTNPKRTT